MDKDFIAKRVKELEPWYQTIKFGDILTTTSKTSGVRLWKIIKKYYLSDDLRGYRILDLGCNAGYFTVQAAILGAKVTGVELNKTFLEQANFTKQYFEEISGKKLDVKFIKSDIGSLDFQSLGKFDYIFAIAVLYHIGKQKFGKYSEGALKEQEMVIGELTKLSDKILVRTRNANINNVEHYSEIFKKFGFRPTKVLDQGRRSLVLYKG